MTSRFRQWWQRPITRTDRVFGAIAGAFGGFWLPLLGRLFLGPSPVSVVELGIWSLTGLLLGIVAGAVWPRIIGIVFYPFVLLGFGSS